MSAARPLALLVGLLLTAPAVAGDALPNGIAAGDVSATSVVLWARSTSVGGTVSFHLAAVGDPGPGQMHSQVVADALLPLKHRFEGLVAGTSYAYTVTDLASGEALTGAFRTPAAAGTHPVVRFGVSGDWRGELLPYPAVRNVPERDLDFFVALGDTIYADDDSPILGAKPQAETLEEFRLKHTEVYSEVAGLNALADLRASTAVFVTVDDHEVTDNFAGGADVSSNPLFTDPLGTLVNDSLLYEVGLQAFHEYNPLNVEVYPASFGEFAGEYRLFRDRRFGNTAQLIVLDARSFRDEALPEVANPFDPFEIEAFLQASFDPSRTMLGSLQKRQLLRALRASQSAGVRWKFVMVAEPIQNVGMIGAPDRFEGYAAERDTLLAQIEAQGITNVVFVSADFHGTLVNDLTRTDPATIATGEYDQIPVASFDIITGAVAYDPPLGPAMAGAMLFSGFIDVGTYTFLTSPPLQMIVAELQSAIIGQLLDSMFDVLDLLGGPQYSHLGLEDSPLVDAELVQGSYVETHTYGWTEFEIDPVTGVLTVTTWGLLWYPENVAASDPDVLAALEPTIVQQFTVSPQP